MKTQLTKQEQSFYNDLIEDEILNENTRNSILGNLANFGVMESRYLEQTKREIKEDFDSEYYKYQEFFENSILLFCGSRCSTVGKYGKYFWYTDEDAEIYFIDTVMSNIIFHMCGSDNKLIWEEEMYEDFKLSMKNRGKNLDEYVERYKKICNKNGYEFSLKWNEDKESEKEFYEMLEDMNK